ncbi:hypothetical protein DD238_001535 [Peronospora effusa]|uniref:Uncharacterized protein n=1 Tax=Peronospora effusa TaxID=542832 RepID=A0A3M6VRG5_9STRA|nr:hypothetical protein DD238_001535 [Peronospora effusa]
MIFLTRNSRLVDNDEEEVVPVVLKKGKKSKQSNSTVQTSHSMEEDMPSSQLTQKCTLHVPLTQQKTLQLNSPGVFNLTASIAQELNSVLLSPLSRNRFSLGSMPVAKLKKKTSSKNPFSSPKKVKVKGETSNATDRPNSRPRK